MQAALDWLAGLHAFFWEQQLPEGLWDQGCYWHLATRQEELQQIGGWVDAAVVKVGGSRLLLALHSPGGHHPGG
jgi:acetoin utilization deacetylase AcuC-like enzyme